VESISDILSVHISGEVITEDGLVLIWHSSPWDVLRHRVSALESFNFTIYDGLSVSIFPEFFLSFFFAGTETTGVDGSVQIVPVKISGQGVDINPLLDAGR